LCLERGAGISNSARRDLPSYRKRTVLKHFSKWSDGFDLEYMPSANGLQTGNLFPARLRVSHQDRKLNTNYRRNGKLQSCEPCRKGKLRCDHMTPTCGRCIRRNKAQQCVYHPAPLTKPANLPTPSTVTESSSPSALVQSTEWCTPAPSGISRPPTEPTGVSLPARSEQIGALPPRATRASSLPAQPWSSLNYGQQSIEELRRPLPEAHVRGESAIQAPSTGFIHHTAILDENELSIGILNGRADARGDGGPTAQVPRLYIERGAAVLTLLKELPTFQQYIDKWFSFARGVILIEPMVKIFTSGLWATWSKTLQDQNAKDLQSMSERIWSNTLKPLTPTLKRHMTPREFCNSVTGENLRWEVVGIVVTLVALLCMSLSGTPASIPLHN